eukprot:5708647-Prymnesium_polylepis.1
MIGRRAIGCARAAAAGEAWRRGGRGRPQWQHAAGARERARPLASRDAGVPLLPLLAEHHCAMSKRGATPDVRPPPGAYERSRSKSHWRLTFAVRT